MSHKEIFKACKTPCEKYGVAHAEIRSLEAAVQGLKETIQKHVGKPHFLPAITRWKQKKKRTEKRLKKMRKLRDQLEKALK